MASPRMWWDISRASPPYALPVPVDGVRARQIADTFGATRGTDRTHQGVDIFAARGTPVRSATRGIVVAIRLGNVADFTTVSLRPDNIYFSQAIAAAISSMGFSIIFNIPRRLLPVVAVGGIITVLLRNVMVLQLGFSQTAGSFLGAAVVGVLALKAIHWFHAPNIILTIPSAIPMIPGVLLYRVLFALLNIQDITASTLLAMMRNGVEAVTIIIGIAIGVAIPNIFIHRYIENNKQRTVKDLLDKRYLKDDE